MGQGGRRGVRRGMGHPWRVDPWRVDQVRSAMGQVRSAMGRPRRVHQVRSAALSRWKKMGFIQQVGELPGQQISGAQLLAAPMQS